MMVKLLSVSSALMVFSMTVPHCQTAICIVRIPLHRRARSQSEHAPSMLLKLATLLLPGTSLMMELSMKKTLRAAPLSPWRKTRTNALHTFKMGSPIITAVRLAQVNMTVFPK